MPFAIATFRPHPLVRGGHMQTIVGNYLPHRASFESVQHKVQLSDGDCLSVHEDGPGKKSNDAVLLIHGLGGCYESGYMLRCSAKLQGRGHRVFRMDLRGCGAGIGLARHPLHAGRSDDAAAVLEFVHQQCPQSPIHVVGFSMGANIALKMAGEMGTRAPAHLASLMAICPPIDLAQCSEAIQRGFSRVYDRRFVASLIKHIRQRDALVASALTCDLNPRPRRLKDFDSVFTAPLSGFAHVDDYYARASSGPWLSQIRVPTLIITAASDPIVPVAAFETAEYSASTQLVITPCGGHLGFIAARGQDADCRWIDWRIVDWVAARSRRAGSPVAHETNQRAVEHAIAPIIQLDGAVG